MSKYVDPETQIAIRQTVINGVIHWHVESEAASFHGTASPDSVGKELREAIRAIRTLQA